MIENHVFSARHHDEGHGKDRHGRVAETHSAGGRRIEVVKRVLSANDRAAEENRRLFAGHGVFVLNVMSSPGSGKTTTLVRSIKELMPKVRCGVIVGDICTTNDAERLAVSGAPVLQINTDEFGGDCHLTAHLVEKAAERLPLDEIDLLIVENVGNLVCPAEFDIGENLRVVVLSVTEGEDKPAKYPLMFRVCDATLLNKVDLLPYLDFDMKAALEIIGKVHPQMPVFPISAKTGEGFSPWLEWLKKRMGRA